MVVKIPSTLFIIPTMHSFIPTDAFPNVTTTSEVSNTTLRTVESYYQGWEYKFRIYSLATFTIVGTIGNMLAFLVFIKSKLRLSSHGVYLITLAWVDTLTLYLEVLVRTKELSYSDRGCKIVWYIRNVFRMLEAFLVLTICIDRSICLRFPFSSHKFANLRVSIMAILTQIYLACALCVYTFWQIQLYGRYCNHRPDDYKFQYVYAYTNFAIATVVGEIVTGIVIIALSAYISIALASMRQRARRLSRNRTPTNVVDREVTGMTIALAVSFSILRIPYSITYKVHFIRHYILWYPIESLSQVMLNHALHITAAISYMNYCINFVIYLIFWRAFREKLMELFNCGTSNNGVRRQSSSRKLTESTGV